jgi:hypothetical protein
MFAALCGGFGKPSSGWPLLPRVLPPGNLAGDVVAIFLIIGTLGTFFAAYIAVEMLVTLLSGMLRCIGGGLLGASDDESQLVGRDPALSMDGLAVEDRQRRSRALVIEQLRQLTLRERIERRRRRGGTPRAHRLASFGFLLAHVHRYCCPRYDIIARHPGTSDRYRLPSCMPRKLRRGLGIVPLASASSIALPSWLNPFRTEPERR